MVFPAARILLVLPEDVTLSILTNQINVRGLSLQNRVSERRQNTQKAECRMLRSV